MLGGLAVVCAVLLVDVALRGTLAQVLVVTPWLLAVLWVAYVASFAPHVTTDAGGVLVQNLLRRTFVPWGRITAIDLRLQLELTLDDGSVVRSLGGPARLRRRASSDRTLPDRATEQAGRIVDDWIAAGEAADAAAVGSVRRSWDVPALLGLLAIAVWAATASLMAGS